ncbi:MAG TPA: tetratricopeptide repeat protein [Phycisphaerae bacterium]
MAWRLGWFGRLIPLVALATFLPSLRNGFTGWDDSPYIVSNPHMTTPGGLRRIWTTPESEQYYPLTFTSYWLEYRLWGTNALGYHATNTVLHAINALLVLLWLRAMRAPRWAALTVGLLFAVHPVQTMTVAWIAERKNLLSCMFVLVSLLSWLRFRRGGERWYAAALIAFAAALLSKSAVLTLPLALVALDRLVLRTSWRSSLLRILPMLALSVISTLVTVFFEQKFLMHPPQPGVRPLIAAAAIWFYAFKLLIPAGLLPIYQLWQPSVRSVLWWLPLLGLLAGALVLWRARRRLDALVAYGLIHFVVFLLPTLGLVPFGNLAVTYVSDHYLYIACIGFFLAVVTAFGRTRIVARAPRAAIALATGLAIVAYIVVTEIYIPVFKDPPAMWERTLTGNPECFPAQAGLGRYYAQRQDWQPALDHFRRALAILPDQWDIAIDLGSTYLRANNIEAAEEIFQRVADAQPGLAVPLFNLALIAERTGRPEYAMQLYEKGLAIDPHDARAHVALAGMQLGYLRRAEAAQHFRKAIELRPTEARAYLGLATCQRGQGAFTDALTTLQRGLNNCGEDVALLNMLARIMATAPDDAVRNGAMAMAIARRAAQLTQEQNPEVLDTLAATYAEAGDFRMAVQTAQTAAQLAESSGNTSALRRILDSLELYQRREPLRETTMQERR